MLDLDINGCDEDYVIQRAKSALKDDPIAAKAWMITARTLYPHNFAVQFEAYKIEKSVGHVKEAARCFGELIGKFQQQPEFWNEINNVTVALRTESEEAESEVKFLCQMFKHIDLDIQHKLLLLTADHCEDTQEHCKLLLLLLQRFPSSISTHGPRLVETLLSAEKHSLTTNPPVNCYRKLLVCELLPLLNSQNNVNLELPQKLIYKLLHKALEYHICLLTDLLKNKEDTKSEENWSKLFDIIEFVGKQLGWEPSLINFGNNWCKESYWQKLLNLWQPQNLNWEEPKMLKQLIYCLSLFLIYCLHQYVKSINGEVSPDQYGSLYLLVEAFIDNNMPNPQTHDPKLKKRKSDNENALPYITTEQPTLKNVTSNFMMALNCWELLHSTENLSREFSKLSSALMLDAWLSTFYIDYLIYKAKYDEALKRLEIENHISPLIKYILKANIYYFQSNYVACFDHISEVVTMLPTDTGTISNKLIIGGKQRHLHFLPLTHINVLQFCAKLLLRCIRQNGLKSDMAVGHSLVLMQLDWPQEEDMLPTVIDEINQTRAFYYFLFQTYVIQVDILEELAYLWSSQGGHITLEIVPNMITRRIGTRGSDKGMKEEIKQAIRRQIMRCNEPIHKLIHAFLMQERPHITHTLI